jgi:hypothetical protein
MSLSEQLRDNAEIGAGIIKKYLNEEIAGTDRIKFASLAITQCVKHEATKGHNDALKFAILKAVAPNPEAFRRNIGKNLPEYVQMDAIEDIQE